MHPIKVHQQKKRREDQQLIGNRIQEFSEASHLAPSPGNIAVNGIGKRRQPEHGGGHYGPFGSGLEEEQHEHGNQEDAADRQRVGQMQ